VGIVSNRKWGENLRREESTSVVAAARSIYMSWILDVTRISDRDILFVVLEMEKKKVKRKVERKRNEIGKIRLDLKC